MNPTVDVEWLEERDQVKDNLPVFVSVPGEEIFGKERFEFLQQLLRKNSECEQLSSVKHIKAHSPLRMHSDRARAQEDLPCDCQGLRQSNSSVNRARVPYSPSRTSDEGANLAVRDCC